MSADDGPATESHASGEARAAYQLLVVGLVLIAAFTVLRDTAQGTVIYLGCAAYGTVLTCVGTFRMPRALCRPWLVFVAAQVLFLVGDSLYAVLEDLLGEVPAVSWADLFYLLQYPALALGMVWLVRSRRSGRDRDRAALLDATVLSTGFVIVGSLFFAGTTAGVDGGSWSDAAVAIAYPAGDLLVLAFVVRLFTGGMNRSPALWAMLGSVVTLLAGDIFRELSIASGEAYPGWVDACYLLSYLLLGVAPLHPSVRTLAVPVPIGTSGIGLGRLVWLALALMVAPVTALVAELAGVGGSTWVTAVGGCVIAVLVVLRFGSLVAYLQDGARKVAEPAVSDRSWVEVLGSLRTVYQPIVDLRSGDLFGREALTRFEGEDPWSVFDRARRSGNAVTVETAAIRSALAGWDHRGVLSLNTSVATLLSPELCAALPEDLAAIVIEITEEDLGKHPVDITPGVERLRGRGALIAVDDYGVGFSNVQRVMMVRPDIIKLDMSLIREIDTDWMRQAAVASVRSLADEIGALVLAEGIETEAQLATVRRLGVRLGQGYLLGRPQPLARTPDEHSAAGYRHHGS